MNGQPVCVRYYDPLDHNNYQCLFAVGLKNGNGEDAGPEYYHIIEGGTLEQVQSDWTQTDATQPDFIQHKPDLAAVATSGSYNDLTDTPELADIATTGSYNDLRDVPLGDAGGIAELDSNGKVPSSQLPSYVDDVIEAYYNTSTDRFYEEPEFITLITPSAGKSWVDIPTNKSYRWTGSVYVRVDEGVQLGVTADTAYRGDRGKIAYDHATDANRNTTAQTKKLYKMSVTSEGHVGQVEESTAETDIANLQENVEDLDNGLFKGGWRTPTADELDYIINTRSASTVSGTTNARYAKAQVNNINGLILLPDVFELPTGITMLNINTGNATASDNTYTISQWETLENAGCIFLPCSGYRNGTYMSNINSYGFYSSTTQQDSNYILYLFIHSSYDGVGITGDSKQHGKCVRLIKENTTGGFSISSTLKADIAKSNLQFHCLNKEWRFAPNAYDIIGSDNANIAENYNGYIDLFGFGTSGWNSGAVAYQPWSSDWDDTHYINHNLTGDYKKADWGYNIKKQLHDVAFTGDYNDLVNTPIPIPTLVDEGKMLQVNASGQYELVTIVNSELQPY
jgi:hypothetical protein